MRFQILFTLIILFISTSTYSFYPKDDKKKSDETPTIVEPVYNEGLIYSLPQKGFQVNIKAKRVVQVAGPYANYAQKYLGITDAVTSDGEKWEIVAIWLEDYTEPDANATFKTDDSVASLISVLSNGIISGIGTEGECIKDETIGNHFLTSLKDSELSYVDLSSDDFYEIIVDPETGEESTVYKTEEDKAREAADYLIRLRKKRAYTILSPDDVVPEDGKGYEVFINEAQRIEKEYVALFAGKQNESYHSFSFNFTPGQTDVKNELLFRFSEEKGILAKGDISGKPILLAITKNSNAYKTVDKLKSSENPNAGETGYFYRIPVSADLKISDGVNVLYSGKSIVPQFGVVAPIPENLLNGNYSIQFNLESGSIKSIEK